MPVNFFKSLAADPSKQDQNGVLGLNNNKLAFLVQLMEEEAKQKHQLQLIIEELRRLWARVTTIKAGQMTCTLPEPTTQKNYAFTTAENTPKPPSPPTKADMIIAHPCGTIIHSREGTMSLKEVDPNIVVQNTNKVLETLNTTVRGEKVALKAFRFLPSGDVSFYSQNHQHKDWLNKNKNEWSKKVCPDLESTPSTYSVLAHGILQSFNIDAAANKITLALDNSFLVDKIFKI
ncbi:hypothetical protein PCANC_07332 [Puccinia coronata f. sp. avenae]|uniref:Uncharacterized protein n=1 Tax=Puccinia coronata f. sp. avenae TaxID=200324 RepID=A0A2N5T6J6_9BASI|nr:hypothetical protein PCANC_07332 [Puccinia coronata f. sp. avenae]